MKDLLPLSQFNAATSDKDRYRADIPVVLNAINEEERTIDFVISTQTINRKRHVVIQNGIDWDEFLLNPVFLWLHNDWELPLGHIKNVKKDKDRTIITVYFSKEYEFADLVYRLYREGTLRAVSLGFMVTEYIDDPEIIEEEYPEYKGAYYIFTRTRPFEASSVTIPADALAVIKNSFGENDNTKKAIETSEEFKAVEYYKINQPRVKALGTFLKKVTNLLGIERSDDEEAVLNQVLLKTSDLKNSIEHFQKNAAPAVETPKETPEAVKNAQETPEVVEYSDEVQNAILSKLSI